MISEYIDTGTGDPRPTPECDPESAHLLIVDDDLTSVELVIEYLRDYDFAVSTATSGLEALERARRERPDLILLDLRMPDPDGFQVLDGLRDNAQTRDIPVVVLTARDEITTKVRGFEMGALDYLTKPVAEAELHARVTAHLRRHRMQRCLERRLLAFEQRYGPLDSGEPPADRAGLARQEVDKLCRARRMLRERLTDPPSLNELARAVGTNQPRLSRGFRTLFGSTVYGFVREARLQRARELLSRTDWPVKTIALEIGYRNTSDLSRGVRERFGMSPSQLRHGR